eukprot:365366-Chlamydomonas_euryale.AAC.15
MHDCILSHVSGLLYMLVHALCISWPRQAGAFYMPTTRSHAFHHRPPGIQRARRCHDLSEPVTMQAARARHGAGRSIGCG